MYNITILLLYEMKTGMPEHNEKENNKSTSLCFERFNHKRVLCYYPLASNEVKLFSYYKKKKCKDDRKV